MAETDPRDMREYLKEYGTRDDEWLLEHCEQAAGKARTAMYALLVQRGYTAKDIEKRKMQL